jgi:c-di-GMP-related signal transduction protein
MVGGDGCRAVYDRELGACGQVQGDRGVDVIEIDVAGRSIEAIATEYARLRGGAARLLAANVSTRRELVVVLDLGFDLVAGLFVEIAVIARRKRVRAALVA